MKTLEGHLDCDVFLRGNVLTLDGADEQVEMGETVVRELSDLIRQGHDDRAGHDRGDRLGALDAAREPEPRSSRTSSGATARSRSRRRRSTRSATSTRSAANTVTVGIGPAGTGKSFLAVAMAVAAL